MFPCLQFEQSVPALGFDLCSLILSVTCAFCQGAEENMTRWGVDLQYKRECRFDLRTQ